ncbi:SixA phosphatase family protein [Candidatus Colwellia aromaticivorans]|uniref:SixA phosphatase family protein n=1 Tax=Candidatus Colwellia aromaticivorans TaxID=2267621 RepID=UPI000DF2530B|nr:phosphoglycerate mutase family protein [Candidatus Colwellia aromaticivorans]
MSFHKNLDGQSILSILFFYLLLSSFSTFANNYSIYLVRHAEKLNDLKNPALTVCGKARARQLASLLSQTNITHIYSTHTQRTMQTATPLANQQKIAIKNYNPKYLEQLSLKIQQQKANTLVVGHSKTTPRLVALLTKKTIAPLSEQDYQQLYQIQYIDQQVVLTIFEQPLLCRKA